MRAFALLDTRRLAIFLLLLLAAIASARQPLADPDLWWHLKSGEWIVAHRAIPEHDPFSYMSTQPWVAYSWLAEVVFYEIARHLGFGALLATRSLLVVATSAFIYLGCRAVGARFAAAIIVSVLASLATLGGWAERPQLFMLVLLAFLVWCLRSERLRSRVVWLAPLAVALWANVHIQFVGGVALIVLAAVSGALEGRFDPRLAIAASFAALATLVNPYGWRLLVHVPAVALQPVVIRQVLEFQSPDFGSQLGSLIGAFLLFSIATLSLSRQPLDAFELVTFLVPLAMGLYMVRNMALFAILAAPTVARHLDALLPSPSGAPYSTPRPFAVVIHWLLVLSGMALLVAVVPRARSWRTLVEPGAFPVAAADFLAERPANGRVFGHFNWGGFLIYRLCPAARVAIDGRTQVYDPALLEAYLRTERMEPGWNRFLTASHPDSIVWPADAPLTAALRSDPDWRVAFADDVSVVFEPSAGADPLP